MLIRIVTPFTQPHYALLIIPVMILIRTRMASTQ